MKNRKRNRTGQADRYSGRPDDRLVTALTILAFTGVGAALAAVGQRYEASRQMKLEAMAAQQGTQKEDAGAERSEASPASTDAEETDEAAKEREAAQRAAAVIQKAAGGAFDKMLQIADRTKKAAAEPSPDKLNLAYIYPEDSSSGDIRDSFAGQVFQKLTEQDSKWMAELYELAAINPAAMAERLGKSPQAALGRYNPKDSAQDPSNPNTWYLKDWKKINVSFVNGKGRPASVFSNASDILSMASVYTYYHDYMDIDAFSDYARQLWDNSHSYTLSMSDVYYCDGCQVQLQAETEPAEAAETIDTIDMVETTGAAEATPSDASAAPSVASGLPEPISGQTHAETTATEPTNAETAALGQTNAETAVQKQTPSEAAVPEQAGVPASEEPKQCPGHIDLYIRVKTAGLEEMLQQDSYEWSPETIEYARTISRQNLFADYSLSADSICLSNPLSQQEIDAYMNQLPADISGTRREMIQFALSSVGRVPYYWGGKASGPGYEGNHFGALVFSDEKGRILKGLDCSGWISWVYWSVTGQRLEGQSTGSLISCGDAVSRSQLKPGDIIIRTGENAHAVMFLSWSADGRMNVIHESSDSVNNVTIKTMDAAWPYYRKLVD
ncbi:MAG: NlpC/P60 family protein [Lachnospiraceae bacterium]|nr:NlpC/P60 family protein [Lachnospiraceae bacterium]